MPVSEIRFQNLERHMIEMKENVAGLTAIVGEHVKTNEKILTYTKEKFDKQEDTINAHDDRINSLENLRIAATWLVGIVTGVATLAWNSIESWIRGGA